MASVSFSVVRGLLVGREEILKILVSEQVWVGMIHCLLNQSEQATFKIPNILLEEIRTDAGRLTWLKQFLEINGEKDWLEQPFLCAELEEFVFIWPKSSPLAWNKFVIGETCDSAISSFAVNQNITTVESILFQGFDDWSTLKRIRSFGIPVESHQLQTFIIPDA